MKLILNFFIFVFCGFLLFSVIGCGKMSDPKPIENSGYPHVYPKV